MTAEPGTGSRCSYPICSNRYDAAMVMSGQARADGWRLFTSLNLRLCPDHSPLWTQHGHAPTLDLAVKVLRCGCGWKLSTRHLTAGRLAEEYLGHLYAVQERLDHPLPVDPAARVQQVAGELVDMLLRVGAWGLDDSRRPMLRQYTLAARATLAAAGRPAGVDQREQDEPSAERQDLAGTFRAAAAGRREYAATASDDNRTLLEHEAATLDGAARVAEGDLDPLYSWLPAWRWTFDMHARLRPPARVEGTHA